MTGPLVDPPKRKRKASEKRIRTELVAVRYTPAEHSRLTEMASLRGMTVPQYIRHYTVGSQP